MEKTHTLTVTLTDDNYQALISIGSQNSEMINEVINRSLDNSRGVKDEYELSEEELRGIEEAEKDIAAGRVYPAEQVFARIEAEFWPSK